MSSEISSKIINSLDPQYFNIGNAPAGLSLINAIAGAIDSSIGTTVANAIDSSINSDKYITKTVALTLYQWTPIRPEGPEGTSTFSWSTLKLTSYSGLYNWEYEPPVNPGIPGLFLWTATKMISAAHSEEISNIVWTAGDSVVVQIGINGTAGLRTATPTIYLWDITIPSPPTGNSEYNWESGTLDVAPFGWSLTPTTAPSAGYTLWTAKVHLYDSSTVRGTLVSWVSAIISALSYAGTNGGSSRIMYARIAGNPSPVNDTVITIGDTSFPDTSNHWGISASWAATDPAPASINTLYQANGIYTPSLGTTAWSTPYISSLKVGSLSAITVNTGALNVTGDFVSGSAAVSGTSMTGYGGILRSDGTFAFGNPTTNISFNGSQMTLNGNIVGTGNIVDNAISTGKILNNAVTSIVSTAGKSISIASSGGTLIIFAYARYSVFDNAANLVLKRGGTSLGEIVYIQQNIVEPSGTLIVTEQLPAGTYTYRIVDVADRDPTVIAASITIIEYKR